MKRTLSSLRIDIFFAVASSYPQVENDLGERMHNASIEALKKSVKAVIVGTDCPQMAASDFAAAFDVLNDHDMVIGPSV